MDEPRGPRAMAEALEANITELERQWAEWGPEHPVARAIATGLNWLGESGGSSHAFAHGDSVTRDGLDSSRESRVIA